MHLHFVYWQQTAGAFTGENVKKTTLQGKKTSRGGAERDWTGGAHANLQDFMGILEQDWINDMELPANVVSHDSVKPETCRRIVRLNIGAQNW